ncbi:hypothetical protein ACHAW5_010133 [Stephanodiscus triporus]|uniref:Uncharacterized protein n=1 Tax=Stephanodiscus triporus TaxID=2934178 RepID=A0ABD3MVD4_9STRA
MRTHRVGAMPQRPKGDPRQHDQSHQGRGTAMTGGGENNRARVHSGMSLEDLKRETAYRLAQSDGLGDGSPGGLDDLAGAGVGAGVVVVRESPRHHHHRCHHHLHAVPAVAHYQQQQQQQQHGRAHRQQQQQQLGQHHHSYIIRGGEPSPPAPAAAIVPGRQQQQQWRDQGGERQPQQQQQQQQRFSTPWTTPMRGGGRHHHPHATTAATTTTTTIATALRDRGSAENSVGSADLTQHFSPGGGGGGGSSSPREARGMGVGGGVVRRTPPSPSASKGNHHRGTTSSSTSTTTRHHHGGGGGGGRQQDPNSARGIGGGQRASSVGGRRTPVLGDRAMEGQVLFASPKSGNGGRPGCRPRTVTSPNHIGPQSPDQQFLGGYSKASGVGAAVGVGVGGAYHGNNKDHHKQQQHQSKLPHGLTVQELKEMTRARLAAEAEVGYPDGSSDQSVHSSGTRGSSMGSDQFARTNNSEFNYPNQGIGSRPYQGRQTMQQMQARNSPHYIHPRHPSPVLGPGPFHIKGNPTSPAFGGDTWETASATSSTIASEYQQHADSMYRHDTTTSFASPMGDSNAIISNRGRAFSAGATNVAPYSFERHQAAYYDSVSSSTAAANRQRCATVSPPVMSRPHEDYRYLFSNNDRERLAIPPLSEPRLRSRTAGGVDAFSSPSRASPPASAFVPIGRTNDRSLPNSPHRNFVRSKFGYGDRAFSSGSAASGHGDLPSSMAEAVLGSVTSVSAPGEPIGGQVILASPFRATDRETDIPFRESGGSGLMQESSVGMSLFSSGFESKNIFTCNSGDRMSVGTHSWGGSEDGPPQDGLSDDFSYLLNLSGFNGPPLRGRAATEPVWFGGSDTLLVHD